MDRSQTLTLAFGAAVLAAMVLSYALRALGIPDIVVAALAIINGSMLSLGVAMAAVLERWGPKA